MTVPKDYLAALAIILVTMFVTVRIKKLTLAGAVTGGIIGAFVFLGAGFTGIAMMAAFFILGTAATSWKGRVKVSLGIAETNAGQRTAMQVLANAGLAGFIGLYIYCKADISYPLQMLMAAAFSAATADTLSSELGNVYGRRFYNVTSFKKDERGLNGVISLEGTMAGVAGSIIIAAIYSAGYGWTVHFIWIIIAGTIGNLADSVLGATLERRHLLGNDMVNFFTTCSGALAAALLVRIME